MVLPYGLDQRFEALRVLGQGMGGVTYLVRERGEPGRLLALKVLKDAPRKEFEVLQGLSHPHVVRLFESGASEGASYYTSEYIEGNDLVSEARSRDWNAVFQLLVQAAWALQYLHDNGVLHRDLKPSNLLVGKIHGSAGSHSEDDRLVLKVIDFGLAVPDKAAKDTAGSLAYMAPEVLEGKDYDHRADLYSLGVVLYELALGKLPFVPQERFAAYLKKLREHTIDLTPLQEGDVPKGVVDVITKLTQKDPQRRPKEAREIIVALNQAENESFPLSPPSAPSKADAKNKKSEMAAGTDASLTPAAALAQLQSLSRSGRKAEARTFAQSYLETIATWSDPQLVEDFFASAIHASIEQGLFDEAAQELEQMEAHPALRTALHKASPFESRLLRANLSYRQGRSEEASAVLRSVPKKDLKKATLDQQARFENLEALLAQASKDWQGAADHYERAAEISARSGRRDHQASLLTNAGSLYFEQGKWIRAYALFREALDLARGLGQSVLIATLTNNLGNLYLYFGRWTEADAILSESLDLAEEQELGPLIASNLYLLTVAEEGKGNWERVAALLEQSLSFTRQLGEAQPILQALLAKGYFELARKDFAACARTVDDLLQKAASNAPYLLRTRWLLAKLKLAKGETSPEVDAILDEVEADARKRRSEMTLWQVAADRGDLARALGIVERLVEEVPEEFKDSFWRDRKKERLRDALSSLAPITLEQRAKSDTGELLMDLNDAAPLSFRKWTDINRRLLVQRRVEPLLEEILDAAIALTDAERGFVIHSENQDLAVRATRNFEGRNPESPEGEKEKFSFTIAREVMRKGEPVISLDAQADERFSEAASVQALQIRSVLCVPLRSGFRTVGLVYLDNRFRQGVFRKEHIPVLETLADQASLALEHARLHGENERAILELRKSNATIERLNIALQKDLGETSAHLESLREGMKRLNEEAALKFRYDKIIGKSPKIREVLKTVDGIVDTDMSVFILGESGTGKELIARAIHFNGPRKDKPFIAENCAALPETLLETELFGHVRGAFTGAEKDRPGLFEAADGGTLFLDEVGDMPASMQAKLLRALETGEIRRVGGKDYRKVDVRVVSASNKDLKELMAQGRFRSDLYYRLHVARIKLPPLRERREDIPLLLDHFLTDYAREAGEDKPKITKAALKLLMDYDWPGNIRELQNEVTRLCLMGREITPDFLSSHLLESAERIAAGPLGRGLDARIQAVEKKAVQEALERTGGNKLKAAKLLKIGRRTLYAKIAQYRIPLN